MLIEKSIKKPWQSKLQGLRICLLLKLVFIKKYLYVVLVRQQGCPLELRQQTI